MRPATSERGAAALLVVPTTLAVCAVAMVGITRAGTAATQRARVDAVADLVALAAVGGGDTGATDVASANGAVLVEARGVGTVRTVVIRWGALGATASAAPLDEAPR